VREKEGKSLRVEGGDFNTREAEVRKARTIGRSNRVEGSNERNESSTGRKK
jgi:hypothetical protein